MEISKKSFIKLVIALILVLGCDTVYNFQSKVIDWKLTSYPNEIIYIEGVSFAYPTLNKITIIKKDIAVKGELVLLLSSEIPERKTLNKIYKIPLDSLVNNNSFFEMDSARFYFLGFIDLVENEIVNYELDRPIVHSDNYVFAIPSIPVFDVSICFGFQRIGDSQEPKIEKLKI